MKKEITSKKADVMFSKMIRERDKRCQKCGRYENLQCSHFWGRDKSATRYDFDNCVTLCAKCHFQWEGEKAGAYREFMIMRLGKERYEELEAKHNRIVQRREAINSFIKNIIK